jgi:hypothetical protein
MRGHSLCAEHFFRQELSWVHSRWRLDLGYRQGQHRKLAAEEEVFSAIPAFLICTATSCLVLIFLRTSESDHLTKHSALCSPSTGPGTKLNVTVPTLKKWSECKQFEKRMAKMDELTHCASDSATSESFWTRRSKQPLLQNWTLSEKWNLLVIHFLFVYKVVQSPQIQGWGPEAARELSYYQVDCKSHLGECSKASWIIAL